MPDQNAFKVVEILTTLLVSVTHEFRCFLLFSDSHALKVIITLFIGGSDTVKAFGVEIN